MDVEFLARLQFAVTAAFHFLYPPISIGLGLVLVMLEGMWLKTKDPVWYQATRFWGRVFFLTFAIGVTTGIVMEFEFGTNWAEYSRFVGDVFGSPLAAEGVFAFFLESCFLGLMFFGWNRIKPGLHFFSTLMVAVGAHLSALWILVANSWMHTPAGFELVTEAGRTRAEITDFWAMVFNPSTMDRLSHTLMGAWQTGAWMVISICAWHLLKRRAIPQARAAMITALFLAAFASLASLASGHSSSVGVAENQPAKLAAFEGHWEASAPADLYLLGWVNEANETTWGIKLPGMLSWLVHFDATEPVTGLHAFPKDERPPVNIVFQTYHLMVVLGMLLIGMSLLGVFLVWRRSLEHSRWYLVLCLPMVLVPQLANQVGWMSAEIGRQPWLVQNLMRTSDGLSTVVNAGQVLFSLILFTLIYTLLMVLFLFVLGRKIGSGPNVQELPTGVGVLSAGRN